MNRLSLLSGPLPNSPKQHIKEAAYIQYLKSFSQNGLETLQKLEAQFNKHFCRQNISEEFKIFKKLQTLISSYEVFALEMNDSCHFIQVPEFGTCILRVFIQLIGILKWTIQHLLSHKKVQGIVTSAMQQTQSNCFMNQAFNSTLNKRDSHMMRNTFNGAFGAISKQNSRCSLCSNKLQQNNSNQIYKIKQQAGMQLKDINEEIVRITKQYTEEQKKSKKQDIERNQLKKFIQKREQQGKCYISIGLGEQSKNQQILTQILYTLNKKGQAIGRFADLRINSLNQTNKIQLSTQSDYQRFKQDISSNLNQKVQQAKHKLSLLFKEHIIQYQKQKKEQLIDTGIQIQQSQSMKLFKLFQQKLIKKYKNDIKNLQKQLQFQRSLNEGMKKLLQEKSIQFEGEVIKYRNQLINLQFKSRKDIQKSSKKQNHSKHQHKQEKKCIDSDQNGSFVSIEMNNLDESKHKHLIKYEQSDEDSNQFNQSRITYTKNNFARTGKRLSRTKTVLKFQHVIQKSYLLDINSSVINFHQIFKKEMTQNYQQIKFTKISFDNRLQKKNIQTQTTHGFLQNYARNKFQTSIKTQRKTHNFSASKASKASPSNSKSRANIISYVKKRSSHMGQLSDYFQIRKANQNDDQQKKYSSGTFNRLLSKSNKLFQRNIVSNQMYQNKDIINDFMPIIITTDFNEVSNYKKNNIVRIHQFSQKTQHSKKSYQKQIFSNQKVSTSINNPCPKIKAHQILLNLFINQKIAEQYQEQVKSLRADCENNISADNNSNYNYSSNKEANIFNHTRSKLSLTQFSSQSNFIKRTSRQISNFSNAEKNIHDKVNNIEVNKNFLSTLNKAFKSLEILRGTNFYKYQNYQNILQFPYSKAWTCQKQQFQEQNQDYLYKRLYDKKANKLSYNRIQEDHIQPTNQNIDKCSANIIEGIQYNKFKQMMKKIFKIHQKCGNQKQNCQFLSRNNLCSHLEIFLYSLECKL